MPPKTLKNVVPDSTDPATTRPALDPVEKSGTGFIPMDLPPFQSTVNLPPDIKPSNAWGIFLLFFPREQIEIIVRNTNQRKDIDQTMRPKHSREQGWYPMTVEEAYGYLGIRIYIGIHKENEARQYWKPGTIALPSHPVVNVMSLKRYEALHTAFRCCTADSDHEFEAVFDRVST